MRTVQRGLGPILAVALVGALLSGGYPWPSRVPRRSRSEVAPDRKALIFWLEMRFIRDVQTLKAALLAGQLDVAGFGDPQVIAELRGTGRFRTITGPPGSGILMIVPGDQIAHPASPAALQDHRATGYDSGRAKELLAQAGIPVGSTRV
ncbi:MAG: hypothetical protein N0A24_05285 [Armatimonadetes bacterium]|nr:hypothetical protein [Armatimonadota bacterium]MDW8153623.1 hypothetical protein [Armatimonadota bacterium]